MKWKKMAGFSKKEGALTRLRVKKTYGIKLLIYSTLRFTIRSASAASKTALYVHVFLCLKIAPAVRLYKVKWDANARNFGGAGEFIPEPSAA